MGRHRVGADDPTYDCAARPLYGLRFALSLTLWYITLTTLDNGLARLLGYSSIVRINKCSLYG